MRVYLLIALYIFLCLSTITAQRRLTGSEFLEIVNTFDADERDQFFTERIIDGNLPQFMMQFVRIDVFMADSTTGKIINAHYFVMPDYLCIGTDNDFIRMPIQPKYAQRIANHLNCFLSTRKISDDIYKSAAIKLEPQPIATDRDKLHTFVEHNKIIENQRQQRKGLIAGHKKDVIITEQLLKDARDNRVALYGWHRLDGTPIQRIYTGHVDWYVDYSHGFRLIHQTIYINDEPMNYIDVMKHQIYKHLLCDEEDCNHYAYPY